MQDLLQQFLTAYRASGCPVPEELPLELREIIITHHQQEDELRLCQNILRGSHFAGVLQGRNTNRALNEFLFDRFQIYMFDWQYCLAVFRPERFGEAFLQGADETDTEVFDRALDAMTERANHHIRLGHHVHTHRVEGDIISVIRLEDEDPAGIKQLVQVILQDAALLYDIHFSAAISSMHQGIEELAAAYSETDAIFLYREQDDESRNVFLYQDELALAQLPREPENYASKESLLTDLVAGGDFFRAQLALESIFAQCLGSNLSNAQRTKCRLLGLADKLLSAAGAWSSGQSAKELAAFPVETLFGRKTVRELTEGLSELLDHIRGVYESIGRQRDQSADIQRYIDSHIFDYDLSLTRISDALGLSHNRVSSALRRRTGMGVLDYIHTTRLKSAKEYILYSNRTVREIAEQLGYGSSLALNRIFKRYEGVSPNEFRKKYGNTEH